MRKKKYYVYLTEQERRQVLECLVNKRNALIQQGRYTDAVDDVLIKVSSAKLKKLRVKENTV